MRCTVVCTRFLPIVVKSTSSRLSSMLSMLVRNLLNVDESISSSWVSLGSYAFRFFCFSFIFIFLATRRQADNNLHYFSEPHIFVFKKLGICKRDVHTLKKNLNNSASDLHTDLHSCLVVVIPRRRSLDSGFLSLGGCPSVHFSDVPLSRAVPVLHAPRSCLFLDAVVFLQLPIDNLKIRTTSKTKTH